jgi:Protein of unknown function DUF262/Protein of unknown function (DUF1524)/Restriction Enzyme Adenine Methylase Associated
METQVRTPSTIFGQPQRFLVPLFQRPYVWNQEQQWEPLWRDVERVASRLLANPHAKHEPHFLGAIVFQQVQSSVGELAARMIIDGQQRLTTLQVLFDALHAELCAINARVPAGRLEYLIENDPRFCKCEEDRYKVWPTNRDRPAFNEVMSAPVPVNYETLAHRSARLVQAHRFFSEQARAWLTSEGGGQEQLRAEALERSVRELVQLVVIELSINENAQEIFETLNARGAQLTAADLIKNFVFQRLNEGGASVEQLYEKYWKEFETAFWETEVSAGRLTYQRSSLFINHWLISRTGEEVVAREVFSRFKTFADHEAGVAMEDVLKQMSRAAAVYRQLTEAADNQEGGIDRRGLFAYRTKAMESDVMRSVLLALLDPERPPVPPAVVDSALDTIESWLTRRMLIRASTKSYNQMAAEMVGIIRKSEPDQIDQKLGSFLAAQNAETKYWPDDDEVQTELAKMPLYRKISRSRLRMLLEALEDHARGYCPGGKQYAGMRVPRNKFWIEHIMPQAWESAWPPPADGALPVRNLRIHSIGNLTLLTQKLNVAASNGPWAGESAKKTQLRRHDVLMLNRDLDSYVKEQWTDESIRLRSDSLIRTITQIWRVPPNHKSPLGRLSSKPTHYVDLLELLTAGLLKTGQKIAPQPPALRSHIGQILSDGRIDLNGRIFDTPSGAAYHLRKKATNGWHFWMTDVQTKESLAAVRRHYLDHASPEMNFTDEEESDTLEQ